MSPKTKRNILLVDDDREMLSVLEMVLQDEEFRILEAEAAPEGIRLALKEKPDLIILDMVMPDVDGLDMLCAIRQEKTTHKIPVLMLTASDKMRDIDLAFELGANDYLVKPVSFDRLKAKVRQMMC